MWLRIKTSEREVSINTYYITAIGQESYSENVHISLTDGNRYVCKIVDKPANMTAYDYLVSILNGNNNCYILEAKHSDYITSTL
jgi:hypothetical protein